MINPKYTNKVLLTRGNFFFSDVYLNKSLYSFPDIDELSFDTSGLLQVIKEDTLTKRGMKVSTKKSTEES